MAIMTVEIGKTTIAIIKKREKKDVDPIEVKKEKIDIVAIKEKGKEMDADTNKEKKKKYLMIRVN